MCTSDIFLGILAIIFPPIAVWVRCGICSADSVINILLCCLGYFPGLLHAWYIIAKFPESDYELLPEDAESARVTYIYIQGPDGEQRRQRAPIPKNGNTLQGYGTTSSPVVPQPQPHQEANGTWSSEQVGSSNNAAPPSYTEAVGDNKVQNR